MRLILPTSNDRKQAVMQQASDALRFGRLHTVREESRPDGALVVSAKFSDSFGFVDHPRLTVRSTGELEDFRCDCAAFRSTRSLCGHCAALMDTFFEEICNTQETAPEESPIAPVLPQTPPPVEQISYSFSNSRSDLYPGKAFPQIPLTRYYQVFGNNARARSLFKCHPGWGGSCFGFATSASMFFTPSDPMSAPEFKVGAVYPADLALTSRSGQLHMTLHTLLECMQIMQYGNPVIQRPRNLHVHDPNCLDALCRRVLRFQQTRENPVGMGVARNPNYDGCHEVFPYWLEISPNGQDRLHIYDPNHPKKTRYAYLEKDENGHYINWRFAMFDNLEYASAEGGQLFFDDYSDYKNAWDSRGGASSEAMLSVPRKVAIASTDGKLLFRVTEEGTESFCDDIYQVIVTDLGDEADAQVILNLPAGNYLVRNEDPQRNTLRIMMTHTQQSITVTTTAPQVEILADDASRTVSARIAQADCRYCMELDAVYEDESRSIQLEGITAEGGLTFGCCNGTLQAEGSLSEELANLYIDEELNDLSCIARKQTVISNNNPVSQKQRVLLANAGQEDEASASDETD